MGRSEWFGPFENSSHCSERISRASAGGVGEDDVTGAPGQEEIQFKDPSKFAEDVLKDDMTVNSPSRENDFWDCHDSQRWAPSTSTRHPDDIFLQGGHAGVDCDTAHKQRAWFFSMPSCDYLQTGASKCTVATAGPSALEVKPSAACKPTPVRNFATEPLNQVLPSGRLATSPAMNPRLKEWTVDRASKHGEESARLELGSFRNCKETKVPAVVVLIWPTPKLNPGPN